MPCSNADTLGIQGRDGIQAKSRELKLGRVTDYEWLGKDGAPVIPANKRQYIVSRQDSDFFGAELLKLARALGLGGSGRLQFMSDGAVLLAKLAGDAFKGAEFTVDFYHACGYLIGSGHIESGFKSIVGARCKQAGMHWRHCNAAYVSAIRAAIRSNNFKVA